MARVGPKLQKKKTVETSAKKNERHIFHFFNFLLPSEYIIFVQSVYYTLNFPPSCFDRCGLPQGDNLFT